MDWIPKLHSALGVVVFAALAFALSENRHAARLRVAVAGTAVQIVLAVLLLEVPATRVLFASLNRAVSALQEATRAGSSFVFGYLGGAPLPFTETLPGASFVLAFHALPLILVVSALTALLTYWQVLPWLVRGFSFALERTLGVGGAVGLSAAANVFVGMVEAPLFIRPYLASLTRSELFVTMACGMATIAGTVLVLYASILGPVMPDAVAHLLVASVLSIPAAITVALLMVPETGTVTSGATLPPPGADGAMDAIARGTASGLTLVLNVAAMLIVLVALVQLANALLALGPQVGGSPLSCERVLGWFMAPLLWLTGMPWREAVTAGALMGVKTVLNEFIAYLRLAALPADALGERSRLILVYALSGFANFGSLGILVGGLTAMVPERRAEIIGLGLKSIVAGTLATLTTGAVVGLLR
ncbi:MAG: nucleoside:proton symporter [Gammaproteobacteria bacterium]|nr:nucleoside:proton symporter [Gammaproteobacteria bacterium]